jgi:RNA polymerase sigma factor (sigma-70 family)
MDNFRSEKQRGCALNYGGLFESWEIAVAKRLINDYRKAWKCLEREGSDDLLQECLIHWLDARDGYDPGRNASKQTFMAKVIRNKLGNIIKKSTAEKRKTIYESVSLDTPLGDDEGAPTLKDKIPDTASIPQQANADLKICLFEAYRKLTPQQKKLCRLLGEKGLSMTEAGKEMKKQRRHLYREIARIRAVFEKEGLKDYL